MIARTRARHVLAALGMLALAGSLAAQSGSATFVAVADSARRAPAADARVAYGSAAAQFAELRLPRGAGPHPVVVLLHGGCWLNSFGVDHVAGIAESLRRRGIAVFAVEYRRVGDAGAGVPGTFEDLRTAFDSLRVLAPRYGLDLSRLLLMGHSAGGHLALWLASEPGVRVNAVIALAAVTDLAAFSAPSGCGSALPRLMGGATAASSELSASRYAAASPVARAGPPPSTKIVLVTANADRIVPPAQADAYLARFPATRVQQVPGGHFDLVAPWTSAWERILELSLELIGDR